MWQRTRHDLCALCWRSSCSQGAKRLRQEDVEGAVNSVNSSRKAEIGHGAVEAIAATCLTDQPGSTITCGTHGDVLDQVDGHSGLAHSRQKKPTLSSTGYVDRGRAHQPRSSEGCSEEQPCDSTCNDEDSSLTKRQNTKSSFSAFPRGRMRQKNSSCERPPTDPSTPRPWQTPCADQDLAMSVT